MKALILINIAAVPYFIIAASVGGKYISLVYIFAVILAAMTIGRLSVKPFKKVDVAWVKLFVYFLCFSLLGLIASPYESEAWGKGLIQLVGITIMLLMGVGVTISLSETPDLLIKIVRVASVSIGIFASVGLLQFVFWNLTPYKFFLSFYFLNDWFGALVWKDAGVIGGIHRINSFSQEPTHFGRYMGFVVGWALIRLGVFGEKFKVAISSCVPKWTAIVVLLGFILSISMNAWLLLVVAAVALILGLKKINPKMAFLFVSLALFIVVGGWSLIQNTNGALKEKFNTINLIFDSANVDFVKTEDLTSLAFASNATVAVENLMHNPLFGGGLGSHPMAYRMFAPSYVYLSEPLIGLNADDADSLMLRLISETGVLGLLLFLVGVGALLFKSRALIILSLKRGGDLQMIAISSGLFSSTLGVLALYLMRTGHYYDPIFWLLIALLAGSNNILNRELLLNEKKP